MLKTYKVGGHKFSVSISDESPLWSELGNYQPFLVDESSNDSSGELSSDILFCLDTDTSSDIMDTVRDLKQLAEFDDDIAFISVMSGNEGERVFLISLNRELKEQGGVLVIGKDMHTCRLYMGTCKNLRHGVFVVNNALMLLYTMFTSVRNTMLIHSSVVVSGGCGYAFLGKSGTGKSTHTRLWLQNIPGAWLLNDDNPVVRTDDDGSVFICGTPWSGKTPCYRNEEVPLRAVVRLSQAPHNSIRRLTGVSAYAALAPSASSLKWERKMADGLHDTLSKVITRTGIYHLECLPDAGAALLCHETVKSV